MKILKLYLMKDIIKKIFSNFEKELDGLFLVHIKALLAKFSDT